MFELVTKEQITRALEQAQFKNEDGYIYEISSRSFGVNLNLPRFREKLLKYKITGETRVSWVCNEKKVNKKTLIYTDKYSGCMKRCILPENLVEEIWLECNKWQIIDLLKSSRDYNLYKDIYTRLSKE